LQVITTSDEDMSVNCFVAWDEHTREAVVFDTGFDVGPVCELLDLKRLMLSHICITHGHSDHVEGLTALGIRFPSAQLHWNGSPQHECHNRTDEIISLGRLKITHRLTPGHATAAVTYVILGWPGAVPPVAVVGDALFAGSAGLSPAGWDVARRAVQNEILSLPGGTLICPGHGPLTTVAEELAHNPFF